MYRRGFPVFVVAAACAILFVIVAFHSFSETSWKSAVAAQVDRLTGTHFTPSTSQSTGSTDTHLNLSDLHDGTEHSGDHDGTENGEDEEEEEDEDDHDQDDSGDSTPDGADSNEPSSSHSAGKDEYTRALVMASLSSDQTGWVQKDLATMIESGQLTPAIYVVDDPKAPLHPPVNKGNEAMVYLTYIIDNYDDLQDISIFMHGHRWAWHNEMLMGTDAVGMIQRLSAERVIRNGWMNLRCSWDSRCDRSAKSDRPTPEEAWYVIEAWPNLFPNSTVPDGLASPCCAQFAVSRERIRRIPKEQYLRMREWLITTKMIDFQSGRVMEFIWQYVFLDQVVSCPIPDECHCDGYGVCFGGQDRLEEWYALRELEKTQENELRTMRDERQAVHDKNAEAKSKGEKEAKFDENAFTKKEETLVKSIDALRRHIARLHDEALERGEDREERKKSRKRYDQ